MQRGLKADLGEAVPRGEGVSMQRGLKALSGNRDFSEAYLVSMQRGLKGTKLYRKVVEPIIVSMQRGLKGSFRKRSCH